MEVFLIISRESSRWLKSTQSECDILLHISKYILCELCSDPIHMKFPLTCTSHILKVSVGIKKVSMQIWNPFPTARCSQSSNAGVSGLVGTFMRGRIKLQKLSERVFHWVKPIMSAAIYSSEKSKEKFNMRRRLMRLDTIVYASLIPLWLAPAIGI